MFFFIVAQQIKETLLCTKSHFWSKDHLFDFFPELPVKIIGKTDAKMEKQFLVSDDIILVCELSSANASVCWYKDGQLIDDTKRYCCEEQGVFRSLVVLNAGLEDSGEYTCHAGDDKMAFNITVKGNQTNNSDSIKAVNTFLFSIKKPWFTLQVCLSRFQDRIYPSDN